MIHSVPSTGKLVRPRLVLPMAALLAGAAWILLLAGPAVPFPLPCLVHAATGWHCPGCGMTRAALALARGDWPAAFGHNFFGMAIFLAVAAAGTRAASISFIRNRWVFPVFSNRMGGWLFLAALLWMVARNLPFRPFLPLAP